MTYGTCKIRANAVANVNQPIKRSYFPGNSGYQSDIDRGFRFVLRRFALSGAIGVRTPPVGCLGACY